MYLPSACLDDLRVAPTFRISVLQPNKCCTDIRWTVLDVVHDDRLFAPSWHKNFRCFVVIAVGALIERALNAYRIDICRRIRHPPDFVIFVYDIRDLLPRSYVRN